MIGLLQQSDSLLDKTSLDFQRSLHAKIEWSDRLIGIKGARGTGKTTLLLQYLKQLGKPASEAAYITLDDIYFATQSLVETAKKFLQQGGRLLAIDEVHKYPAWSREIKNLYDLHPDLQIIFTGSSVIDISRQEADLSRRAMMYELHGLSFREYLAYIGAHSFAPIQLHALLEQPEEVAKRFPSDFKPYKYFPHYLEFGTYPFFRESETTYHARLRQLVRAIIEFDMAELRGFDIRNAKKMLQLLAVVSQSVPFKPNITKLAEKSGVHRNSVANYLYFLEEARLLGLLHAAGQSTATLQKPEKIYLSNPNLLHALAHEEPEAGTLREVFFHSQLRSSHRLTHHPKADFEVDGKFVFEIGGKRKSGSQIQGLKNAWLVKDEIDRPIGNAIPIWMFGFLY